MNNQENLIGKKFNRLTVTSLAYNEKSIRFFNCICECGADKIVREVYLKYGHIKSCGCAYRDRGTHGWAKRSDKNSEYTTWHSMKQRCYNPKTKQFKDYGGRGITVCGRWLESFENFLVDMGKKPTIKHTIERKDTNKGYSPDNCRWATYKEQAINKRTNVLVTFKGETKTIAEWADGLGIARNTLYERYKKNGDMDLENKKANHKNHKIEYKGEIKTLKEWSSILGIKYHVLLVRYRNSGVTNFDKPFKFRSKKYNKPKKP